MLRQYFWRNRAKEIENWSINDDFKVNLRCNFKKKHPVFSCIGAAGSVEAAFTVLSCYHGELPPTLNLTKGDDDMDLDYVPMHKKQWSTPSGRYLLFVYIYQISYHCYSLNCCEKVWFTSLKKVSYKTSARVFSYTLSHLHPSYIYKWRPN